MFLKLFSSSIIVAVSASVLDPNQMVRREPDKINTEDDWCHLPWWGKFGSGPFLYDVTRDPHDLDTFTIRRWKKQVDLRAMLYWWTDDGEVMATSDQMKEYSGGRGFSWMRSYANTTDGVKHERIGRISNWARRYLHNDGMEKFKQFVERDNQNMQNMRMRATDHVGSTKGLVSDVTALIKGHVRAASIS